MKNSPIRVLYVNGDLMDGGGISSFMMNYYRHIDHSRVHIDFLVHGNKKSIRDEEIIASGSNIYHVTPKSKSLLANVKQITDLFESTQFDIVHAHADSGNAHVLKIAKKCGIKVRISHSHNTYYTVQNKIHIILNEVQKKQISKYATNLWACSQEAGTWLYGNLKNVEIVRNAIDIEKYRYNDTNRAKIRKELNIENKFVIGMVGRFDFQKNHNYAISILEKVVPIKSDIVLVMLGDGQLKKTIEKRCNSCGLIEHTRFVGLVKDTVPYYSTFDAFIMPSLFEGLGIAAIEAQCAGLPVFVSDKFPTEVNVTSNVLFLPIYEKGLDLWCKMLLNNIAYNRKNLWKRVKNAGYDIRTEARKLQNRYFELTSIET